MTQSLKMKKDKDVQNQEDNSNERQRGYNVYISGVPEGENRRKIPFKN